MVMEANQLFLQLDRKNQYGGAEHLLDIRALRY